MKRAALFIVTVSMGIGSAAMSQETNTDIQLRDLGVEPQYQHDQINDNSPTPPPRETWIEEQRREQEYRDHNETQLYIRGGKNPATGEVKGEVGVVSPY